MTEHITFWLSYYCHLAGCFLLFGAARGKFWRSVYMDYKIPEGLQLLRIQGGKKKRKEALPELGSI